jgi:hypothetical protein
MSDGLFSEVVSSISKLLKNKSRSSEASDRGDIDRVMPKDDDLFDPDGYEMKDVVKRFREDDGLSRRDQVSDEYHVPSMFKSEDAKRRYYEATPALSGAYRTISLVQQAPSFHNGQVPIYYRQQPPNPKAIPLPRS